MRRMPHLTVDPIFIGAQIVTALQGDRVAQCRSARVGRRLDHAVQWRANSTMSFRRPRRLIGTVRTLNKAMREMARDNLFRTVTGIATALGGVGRDQLRAISTAIR